MKFHNRFFALILTLLLSFGAKAQIDFGTFLEGGVDDANTIMGKYLEPAFIGIGKGINSGWYNTAKPHKLLGFDITPTVTMALVPSDAEFFTINSADYRNISTASGQPERAPTLLGPNWEASRLPLLNYTNGSNQINITAPTGLGLKEKLPFNAVPTGMVQVGIGIIKNTDLKFRIVPKVKSEGKFEFSMFGIGVMHDVKQWIPGFAQLPIDLSAFVGWTKINTTIVVKDDPGNMQLAEFSTSGLTIQGLASKKLSILTVFAGLGYSSAKTDFDLKGNFETGAGANTITDPISLKYSDGGFRGNVGFRLKLLILTLHADYAIQKYNTLTVGVGLSVR